jgi:peptidoglycan/LPS O-acetylase OafA/YrhL
MKYSREIDGLRALAVVPVIFFHAGFQTFSGGFVGVDVFFVISGYLITSIIHAEMEAGTFSIVNFYERRARRILPALFLVMFACLSFAWLVLLPSDMRSFSQSLVAVSSFVSNVFFWSERGYFGTAVELKPLIHTWSLAIEEQYYFVFPVLLLLITKYAKNSAYIVLGALGAFSLLLCVWLTKVHADTAFFMLPTRFWELLIGSSVAFAFNRMGTSYSDRPYSKCLGEVLSIVGILLILVPVFVFDKTTVFPGYAALSPTIGTAIVISFAKSDTNVGRVLGSHVFVGTGLVSYSAYLWHQPLFAFARYGFVESNLFVFASLSVVSFLAAFLSWKYVERPFRTKETFSSKQIFVYSLVGISIYCCIGIVGWKTDGFLFRFDERDRGLLQSFVGASDYVAVRFDNAKLKEFENSNGKRRVVLIGDSYGKDFLNAIYESHLIDTFDITTYQINSECGNLYLKRDFTSNIDSEELARCLYLGWYDNKKLVSLIRNSDEIWLSSAWRDWVVDLLPESIENLKKEFGKKIVVVGTKNFGTIDAKRLLGYPIGVRYGVTNQLSSKLADVNLRMKQSLASENFIDISALLCESDTECKIFDDRRKLISYDGGHLTKDGAAFLGRKLIESSVLFNAQ